jgi:hypothetical protein
VPAAWHRAAAAGGGATSFGAGEGLLGLPFMLALWLQLLLQDADACTAVNVPVFADLNVY